MTSNYRDARRQAIETAAYEVLSEKGYKATSMLAIAKRASASNETLYRWYGNKQALFRTLVEENARQVREELQASIAQAGDPIETLRTIGPLLLQLVTSDKAVALNRAAVGDVFETATLGRTIAQAGRGAIAPLIGRVLAAARDGGLLDFDDVGETTSAYISLLIGDLQIQRVIGVCDRLSKKQIKDRSDRALSGILRLYGPQGG